jgi:hypothetical protein
VIIYYGTRSFGRVDEHEGEYAATTFFHIYLLPLIPTRTLWITGTNAAGTPVGHHIPMSGKSVLAGYLRIWGMVATAIAISTTGANPIGGWVAAAVFAALTIWSWTWRSLRGDRNKRRSELNSLAFGTRCEPHNMGADLRDHAKRVLDARWNQMAPIKTPDDVATHGASSPRELVIAYGLLRLGAIERGRGGAAEHAAADRILDGVRDDVKLDGGPYRGGAAADDTSPAEAKSEESNDVDDVIRKAREQREAAAAEQQAAYSARQNAILAQNKKSQARSKIRRARVLAGAATFGLLVGFASLKSGFRKEHAATAEDIFSYGVDFGSYVTVDCDSVRPAWEEYDPSSGSTTLTVDLCQMGDKYIAVTHEPGTTLSNHITGQLSSVPSQATWVQQGLHGTPELDGKTTEQFISTHDGRGTSRGIGAFLALLGLLAWPVYFMWKRKNRALFTSS